VGQTQTLGEFEQLVVLAILKLGAEAHGVAIAQAVEAAAARTVSRGALYTTLDRLEKKGLVRWKISAGGDERNRLPRRSYTVTAAGLTSIRAAQQAFQRLARGLEGLFEEPQ
jgi:DNA-binding PadR family transcriptional regulator